MPSPPAQPGKSPEAAGQAGLLGQDQLALPGLPQPVYLTLMGDINLGLPAQQLGAVEHTRRLGQGAGGQRWNGRGRQGENGWVHGMNDNGYR